MDESSGILVTGATGLVGRRLVTSLLEDRRRVRAVSRNPRSAGLPDEVEIAPWNGRHLAPEALRGVGALVHLAGEPIFHVPLTEERRERIRASRVDSTESLVASLAALAPDERPQSFVCASAIGYYGSHGDAELDESAPPGDDFLARVCVGWENAAREAEELRIRTVRMRFGVVLARDGGALPQALVPFRLGLGGRLGNGRQWFPWVHVEDAVRLVRAALDDARWSGAVNAVSPGIVTNAEFTRALGRLLHRPALLPVPATALRVALGELAGQLLGSRRVIPRAAQERGFRFEHPELVKALRDVLQR